MRRKVANLMRLEHDTRTIGEGLYHSPFERGSTDEIGQLSHAFVALDQKVAERTRALKQEVIEPPTRRQHFVKAKNAIASCLIMLTTRSTSTISAASTSRQPGRGEA